jgi:ribonuclease BN (tRNA processing enzyme)
LINISKMSDVLVHECTLEDAYVEKALARGHSTPS